MGSSHVRLFVIAVLATLAAPAWAAAAPSVSVERSRHLWSTVNVCDTTRYPDTLGIRASMPGTGRSTERMYMRFRAQYFSRVDSRWHDFVKSTDSGWLRVGSATYRARQSGWNFRFTLRDGQAYELRGVVSFQWRRGRTVVRRAARRTTAGHATAFSDPRGYSSATCRVGKD